MKSEIEKLREKFEKDKAELQARCKHKHSTWCEEVWAIAHATGYEVLVCDNCEKKLKRRKMKYED